MTNYHCAPGVKPSEMDLIPECYAILDDAICPLDYTDLTRRALGRIGIRAENGLLRDRAEKIRARLDQNTNGCVIVRVPDLTRSAGYRLYAVQKVWFSPHGQREAFPPTLPIPIAARAEAAIKAGYHAIMRAPYMRTRIPGMERHPRRVEAMVSGLMIEEHVSDWMRRRWPQAWRPAPNDGAWDRPAAYDFGLEVPGFGLVTFDVSGPRMKDDKYGGDKPLKADFHLLSRRMGDRFLFEGVVAGKDFHDYTVAMGVRKSPLRMICWVECCLHGIDYNAVSNALSAQGLDLHASPS